MKLSDLNLTAQQIHDYSHQKKSEVAEAQYRAELEDRQKRLQPWADAVGMCLSECGVFSDNPEIEFKLTMAAIAMVDAVLSKATDGAKH